MRAVEIVEYDQSWPKLFAAERERLQTLLGDRLREVHHIGSTSVPGLAAKPKIDIDAVLRADSFLAEAIARVQATGAWDYHGDPHGDGRWVFTQGSGRGMRLYLCGPENAAHAKRMLFRDWLRAHPQDALAYEALKRRLARAAGGDFAFYTSGKADFVADIVARAEAERGSDRCPTNRP